MGSIWLNGSTPGYPNLLDVLERGGVRVAPEAGWEWNSRSSGGFSVLRGVVIHHTASDTSWQNDVHYMLNGPDNPISNGLLDRDGIFRPIAGGASNHAGKGGGSSGGGGDPWITARGRVTPDNGNAEAFGIEAANNGIGQPWPQAQQDAYMRLVRALCDGYGLVYATDVITHQRWSPPRKCDPTGPSRWALPVGNRAGCNGADLWSLEAFKAELADTIPPPIPEDDDMPRLSNPLIQATGADGTLAGAVYLTDGALMTYRWVRDPDELGAVQYKLRVAGLPDAIETVDMLDAFGNLTGPAPNAVRILE